MSMNVIEDQCPNCFRTFNPDALTRHKPICAKVANKVRKPMDVQKQRIQGTDIQLVKKTARQAAPPPDAIIPKKANWREKHDEFQRNIRYARQAKAAEERGETIAPPPPAEKPSDHVQCPTCGRSFQPNSAERHIKFCAEQARRKPMGNKNKTESAVRREKMMGFKSTFDKKKEQQQQQQQHHQTHYNPSNYGDGGGGGLKPPHSRTLRATENKSAPTPTRRVPGEIVRNNTNMAPARTQTNMAPVRTNMAPSRALTDMDNNRISSAPRGGLKGSRNPPFCYECGIKYPVKTANFCCECGCPRLPND